MSTDKPLQTNTSSPPSGGYRTLTPAGGAVPKSTPAAPKPASPASKAAETPPKPDSTKPASAAPEATKESPHADPTRFGDWEVKGRCIDF